MKSKSKSDSLPDVMNYNGATLMDRRSVVSAFADNFRDSYKAFYGTCPEIQMHDVDPVAELVISEDVLLTALSNLDVSKGAGPDLLPPVLLQRCRRGLVTPLSILFNGCLRDGIFPDLWKISHIVPIFKKGCKTDVGNYRGVAIQSAVPKLLESIVNDVVVSHSQNCVSPTQHGFVRGKSTLTNLIEFNYFAKESMEDGFQTDAFYVDYSKAFDRVPHGVLAVVFDAFQVKGALYQFLMSYLSGRKQYVKIKGMFSPPIEVTSGVPQGSHIGPTMFVLYINSLPTYVSAVSQLGYADDFKFFTRVSSLQDCSKLQDAIDQVDLWSGLFGLDINEDKCMVMSHGRKTLPVVCQYRLRGSTLRRVTEFNDLGVTFDTKGTFKAHISLKTSKCLSLLGFVKRTCVGFKESTTLQSIFTAYIRSNAEYASPVWSPYQSTYVSCIERVQRRFTRYSLMKTRQFTYEDMPPYEVRCGLLKLSTLENRRILQRMSFAYDVLTGGVNCEFVRCKFVLNQVRENARSWEVFAVPFHRTDYGKHEAITAMIRLWNEFLKADRTVVVLESQEGTCHISISKEELKRRVVEWTSRTDVSSLLT